MFFFCVCICWVAFKHARLSIKLRLEVYLIGEDFICKYI